MPNRYQAHDIGTIQKPLLTKEGLGEVGSPVLYKGTTVRLSCAATRCLAALLTCSLYVCPLHLITLTLACNVDGRTSQSDSPTEIGTGTVKTVAGVYTREIADQRWITLQLEADGTFRCGEKAQSGGIWRTQGRYTVNGSMVYLTTDKKEDARMVRDYRIMYWGERLYLVPPASLDAFRAEIDKKENPMRKTDCLLRRGDETKSTDGSR